MGAEGGGDTETRHNNTGPMNKNTQPGENLKIVRCKCDVEEYWRAWKQRRGTFADHLVTPGVHNFDLTLELREPFLTVSGFRIKTVRMLQLKKSPQATVWFRTWPECC